jgi:hypothetical protein
VTELHVHDWSPWGPSPLSETVGVERRKRSCRGCGLYQDEPTPDATPIGPVPESAIEAAAEAVARILYQIDGAAMGYPDEQEAGWEDETAEYRAGWIKDATPLVAAAVPHIERAIRDSIEAELCSEMLAVNTRYIGSEVAAAGYVDGLTVAARVARGGEATE